MITDKKEEETKHTRCRQNKDNVLKCCLAARHTSSASLDFSTFSQLNFFTIELGGQRAFLDSARAQLPTKPPRPWEPRPELTTGFFLGGVPQLPVPINTRSSLARSPKRVRAATASAFYPGLPPHTVRPPTMRRPRFLSRRAVLCSASVSLALAIVQTKHCLMLLFVTDVNTNGPW